MIVLFILLAILLVVAILFVIFFPKMYKKYLRKNYVSIYGKQVYKIALKQDYYLINRLLLKGNDETSIDIDHFLCGNKYIYVIKDYYFEGGLSAKEYDRAWVYYHKSGKVETKEKIDNPILLNKERVKLLCKITDLDPSLIISVVLINNDCQFSKFEGDSKKDFLVTRANLKRFIKSFENRDIPNIKDSQLQIAVKDIAKLNERKKHNG